MGSPRGVGAISGHQGILGGLVGCKYSKARRGIGGIRGNWGLFMGVGDVGGLLGASRGVWGLAVGIGTQGPEGV